MKKILVILSGLFISQIACAQSFTTYSVSPSSSRSSDTGFRFGVTAFQHFATDSSDNPLSGSLFIGEKLGDFGAAGLYGQAMFPKRSIGNQYTGGIQICPSLTSGQSYGRFLLSTKLGYGRFDSRPGMSIAGGLIFEPGSFFHITSEVSHAIPLDDNPIVLSTTISVGIGVHIN